MKTIVSILLFAALSALAQPTNLTPVVMTGYRTNTVTSSGQMTVYGVFTNLNYDVTRTNNVIIGDYSYESFPKINTNFDFVQLEIAALQTNSQVINQTLASNTAPTLPGVVRFDTNYLYVAILTNTWRRVSLPTNTW